MKTSIPILEWNPFCETTAAGPETTLLIGGDFCPTGKYHEKMLAGQDIFQPDLKQLFNADFSIINLEAPLCAPELPPESPAGHGLRGAPAVAFCLKELGIGAVSLANNHARDFGDAGVRQTIAHLTAAGIPTAGSGENLAAAERVLELNLNGLKVGLWALAEKELNLAGEARPGTSWFSPERNIARLKELKNQFDFLLIIVHAGHEFISIPSPRIRDAYRGFIAAGADAVIGHHPHVIQGAEKYLHGFIAYSLGNLVFDTPYVSAYANTDTGYLTRLSIARHSISRVEFIPYKLRRNTVVSPLDAGEFAAFQNHFKEISGILADEAKFEREWEAAVEFRWKTEYRQVLNNFSRSMNDLGNKDYARRSRNLFACPTHTEMIEKIFLMLEEGKLSR